MFWDWPLKNTNKSDLIDVSMEPVSSDISGMYILALQDSYPFLLEMLVSGGGHLS